MLGLRLKRNLPVQRDRKTLSLELIADISNLNWGAEYGIDAQ
jgi:hypothetical protein